MTDKVQISFQYEEPVITPPARVTQLVSYKYKFNTELTREEAIALYHQLKGQLWPVQAPVPTPKETPAKEETLLEKYQRAFEEAQKNRPRPVPPITPTWPSLPAPTPYWLKSQDKLGTSEHFTPWSITCGGIQGYAAGQTGECSEPAPFFKQEEAPSEQSVTEFTGFRPMSGADLARYLNWKMEQAS